MQAQAVEHGRLPPGGHVEHRIARRLVEIRARVLDLVALGRGGHRQVRAVSLASSLPRTWCGTFQPFDGNPTVDVTLELTSLTAMGQMVDLRGSMTLGSVITPVQGNLHAKSDQLDLIPLADPLIAGVEPGGLFLGLQGFSPTSWQSPRLINAADPSTGVGGRLALTSSCQAEIPVQPLW